MTASTVPTEIAAFATRVRAELADLSEEEVEELTGGLEADLVEAFSDDLRRELPDPAEYALELRTAAGLPPEGSSASGWGHSLSQAVRATLDDVHRSLRRSPRGAAVLDFLAVLRPAWWVARAIVATWILMGIFGVWFELLPTGPWWLVLAGLTVVSVQWGRGQWGFPGLGGLLLVGNAIAVVGLVLRLSDPSPPEEAYIPAEGYYAIEPGAALSEAGVTNLYAYDADGQPIEQVRLFDQDGRPVEIGSSEYAEEWFCVDMECTQEGRPLSAPLESGLPAWNVYPMAYRSIDSDELLDLPAPLEQVPAVLPTEPEPDGQTDGSDATDDNDGTSEPSPDARASKRP